jgi:hypothetical protein
MVSPRSQGPPVKLPVAVLYRRSSRHLHYCILVRLKQRRDLAFFLLVTIFGLYVLWDIAALIEFGRVSIVLREKIWSGFITNIIWSAFFWLLFLDRNDHPLATCLFVFLAAAFLRALGSLQIPSAVTFWGAVARVAMLAD